MRHGKNLEGGIEGSGPPKGISGPQSLGREYPDSDVPMPRGVSRSELGADLTDGHLADPSAGGQLSYSQLIYEGFRRLRDDKPDQPNL